MLKKTQNPALFLETRGFSIQSILPSRRVKGFRNFYVDDDSLLASREEP